MYEKKHNKCTIYCLKALSQVLLKSQRKNNVLVLVVVLKVLVVVLVVVVVVIVVVVVVVELFWGRSPSWQDKLILHVYTTINYVKS